jgi:hypothetical protein
MKNSLEKNLEIESTFLYLESIIENNTVQELANPNNENSAKKIKNKKNKITNTIRLEYDWKWSTKFIEETFLQRIWKQEKTECLKVLSRVIRSTKKTITLLGWLETLIVYKADKDYCKLLFYKINSAEDLNNYITEEQFRELTIYFNYYEK